MTWLAETAMLAHGWRRFLLLLVAGALTALSVPPFFVVPAIFVGLPIWLWCLDGAERGRGWRMLFGPAFRIGFFFGLGYFTVAFHWLGTAFFFETGPILLLMPFAIVALAALIAFFWGLASALAHLFWSDGPWRAVTLATFLAAFEFVRGHLFTGFPFDLLGYSLTANDDMMQLASVIGVYGLTFLAALIGLTPALIWPGDGRALAARLAPFALAVLLIAGQIGWGHYRLATTSVADRTDVRLRLVQPLVYEHANWAAADPAQVIDRLLGLSASLTGPDDRGLDGVTHLIWPESALPFFLPEDPDALATIARTLPDKVTLITGSPREEFGAEGTPVSELPAYNSILAINTDGEITNSYDKSHLVPFGEYLPFPQLFAAIGLRQFVPGAQGWAPGNGRRLMQVENTPAFLATICYEAIFSGDLGDADDLKAAQFILNLTNDAWFDGSIGPAQHAHHARLRAVEEGMPMVRAANSGITMLVDPLGRITRQLAPQQAAVLDVVPSERLPSTLFAQWRHWPFLIALLLGLVIAIVTRRRA